MSWCLAHTALEGLDPNEFQSDIRRATLRRNLLCYHWEGCMWSLQCNVEFRYQLSICSGTNEIHEWSWSWSHVTTNGRSVSTSWVSSPLWALQPDTNSVWNLLFYLCGAPSLTRGRVCLLPVTVSSTIHRQVFVFFPILHVTRFIYIQYMQGLVSPGSVQQHR
jgi:hypothetical protein